MVQEEVNIQNLLDIRERWISNDIDGADFSRLLADCLSWDTEDYNLYKESEEISITRGCIEGQPAIVFAARANGSSHELLNLVANYSYQANIEWGVVMDHDKIMVFNSHWLKFGDWFRLPEILWSDLNNSQLLINNLTPDGLISNKISDIVRAISLPDEILMPVDDTLVDSLDYWRDQAMRFAKSHKEIDESIQSLFAQLFVLRAIEDRGMMKGIPSLLSCINYSIIDYPALTEILALAQKNVQSELYEYIPLDKLPEFILLGIIKDLYYPHRVAKQNLRYNFAWIEADVLGRAYEKYLSNVLVPKGLASAQLNIFQQPERDVQRLSVRKSKGVFYTPSFLVKFIVNKCVNDFDFGSNEDASGILIPKMADFSCGSGAFITATVDAVLKKLNSIDNSVSWISKLIETRSIIGIDIDSRATTLARLSLWLRFAEEPNPLPLPSLNNIIMTGDSLGEDIWNLVPDSYDMIVGNPPYIASGGMLNREYLSRKFKVAQGRYDYSYLFVELAINKLNPCGLLGFIMPNRLYTNKDAGILRSFISQETRIDTIIDFGTVEVFANAQVYAGLIFLQKNQNDSFPEKRIRIIKMQLAPSKFANAELVKAGNEDSSSTYTISFEVDAFKGEAPWQLIAPADKTARLNLAEVSLTLSELAGIYQGIKTGANDLFIVDVIATDANGLYQVKNGLGDSYLLEDEFLRPVIYGSEIQRYDIVSTNKMLVYPYNKDGVVDIETLKQQSPGLHDYLRKNQDFLSNRSSIQNSGFKWYELVRKRDDAWLSKPKLMIRDLAMRTSFAADIDGKVFLVGGTAIVPADLGMLLPLLGYLNSSVANWYLRSITPQFNSGFQKFEPQHLNSLPVPNAIIDDVNLSNRLSDFVERRLIASSHNEFDLSRRIDEEIDAMIAQAVGLTLNQLV